MSQQPDAFYAADATGSATPQVVPTPDATALLVGAAILLPAVLVGCGGGGGGGSELSTALTITAIEVEIVTNPVDALVTVNGTAQPATGGVLKKLSGAAGLERDPGKKGTTSSRSFRAHADGATENLDITVTFNPAPTAVASLGFPGFTTYAEAQHLCSRLGFGGSWDDIMGLMGMTYDQAVDFLVDGMRTTPLQEPPSWIDATILTWGELSALSPAAQKAYNDRKWPRRHELKQWWIREIVQTSNPLTERMVAFWANHFVVNIDDIEEPQIAWNWLSLLRTYASGKLDDFLHAMCLHPAMLIYLDNASNVKSRAPGVTSGPYDVPSNENFGRELLELFMLGERTPSWSITPNTPPYSEADVVAVARAFTGHNLDDRKAYLFKADKHDTLPLTILGVGPQAFGGTNSPTGGNVHDIIDTILAKVMAGNPVPRTAQLIVEKLWAEFIGTTPTSGQINGLAQVLIDHDWDLPWLYKALFKHTEFKAGATDLSRKLLKMPLELNAGFYRSLGISPMNDGKVNWSVPIWAGSDADQDPLAPPNVKGWLGGTTWINAKTLVSRFNSLVNFGWPLGELHEQGKLPQFIEGDLERFMLASGVTRTNNYMYPWGANLPRYIQSLIRDPAYHMK